MTISDLEHFKNLLVEREQSLSDWLGHIEVACEDDAHKARTLLEQIKLALERMENKTFGTCIECDGEVELHRLEVQPVSQICIDCISEEEQARLQEEMFVASKIHRALLPQNIAEIEGFDVAVKALAAQSVGGDYYDFLPSDNGRTVRVVIADSMGKGMPAGLLMSNLQGAIRILAEEIEAPAPLIAKLNQWLCRNVPITKFISLACFGIKAGSPSETTITYTNAGHCPPILLRVDGTAERLDVTGAVLGVAEDFTYQQAHTSLFPDDLLLLYTDGVTEAENNQGEMYGEERLIEFIRRHRNDDFKMVLDALLHDVQSFSGRTGFEDDLTVIALRKRNNR